MKHILAALPVLLAIIIVSVLLWLFIPIQPTSNLGGYENGDYYMFILNEDDPFEKKDTLIYEVIDEKDGYVLLMNVKDSTLESQRKAVLKRIFYKIKSN